MKIGRRYEFSSNRFSKGSVCYHGLCGDSRRHVHRLNFRWAAFPCLRCHLPQSHVSDQLIAAYRSASYRVENSSETFILHIDQYSEPLARLFAASGRHCAAFVTAFNPLGTLQTFEAIRPRVRASQADWGNWPGAKAACSRERGPTCQAHGLKRRVSSCSAWISMRRAHSGGSSTRMQSYGLGTMPYRDWFCSTERVRSPGGIIGLASGAGI